MIFLGIDPGTHKTGFAFVEKTNKGFSLLDAGVIRPKASLPIQNRIFFIHQELKRLTLLHAPKALAVESQFVDATFPKTALQIGLGRAIALLIAAEYNLELFEFSPKSIKLALTGSGSANKATMQMMTMRRFNLSAPIEEDAADAVGAALAIAQNYKVKNPCTNLSSALS